jgi:pyridoxal phosphate enzyme (YggS family)
VTLEESIASNLAAVRGAIERAAQASGRLPSAIRLIAVSKTFSIEHVRAAFRAGQREFGENRVQEALEKIASTTDTPIDWHLVGHLQSNKAPRAAGAFKCIHSVDDAALLRKLETAAIEMRHAPDLLVQVDLAGEPTKHGATPDSVRELFEIGRAHRAARIVGLMVLPPLTDDPEDARPFFRRLRELRDSLIAGGVDPAMLRELSMGMSHDFPVAIEEGATMVRVGTAVFGARTGRHP